MEIYKEWAPDNCLGCGASITAGDLVLPVERGWLLCLECAEDYVSGRPLAAWSPGSRDMGFPEA